MPGWVWAGQTPTTPPGSGFRESQFQGTDIVENSEGALEMSSFENPPNPDWDNKYTDLNPQVVGWHDIADAGQFVTNSDDVPGSPIGQGGSQDPRGALEAPIS